MRKILVLLLLIWCIVPACAADIPQDLTDAIPDSARELLDDTDKADSFTSLTDGLSGLWNRTCKLLIVTVQDSLGGAVRYFAVFGGRGLLQRRRRQAV